MITHKFENEEDLLLTAKLSTSEGERARSKLVTKYDGLVRSIAWKYKDKVEHDDLIQVGSIGLFRAIQKHDCSKANGATFKTYATHYINGAILHYVRDKAGTLKLPRDIQELISRINKCRQAFELKHDAEPSTNVIAQILEVPLENVLEALDAERKSYMVSLDQPCANDDAESSKLHEFVLDERCQQQMERADEYQRLYAAIERLPQRLQDVVKLRLEDRTQVDIAQMLGVGQMEISRRWRLAQKKLSKIIGEMDTVCLEMNTSVSCQRGQSLKVEISHEERLELTTTLKRRLPRRQFEAISLYFGLPNGQKMTSREVAECMGIKPQAVYQLMKRGIAQLDAETLLALGYRKSKRGRRTKQVLPEQ
jgi:RNA polymerase sigma factor (sigma-70 family)